MKRLFMFCTIMASILMFPGVAFAAEITLSKENPEYSVYWAESQEEHEGDVMPRKTIAPDPTYGSVGTVNQQVRSIVAAGALPAKYDLRSAGYVTGVKNQGSRGVCWTFSAMSSLESYLKKKINSTYDFSEMHLDYAQATFCTNGSNFSEGVTNSTAIYRNAGTGGNVDMSSSYLVEGGPANESVMPYNAYSGVVSLNSVKSVAKTGVWVRDYAVYPSSDSESHRNVIKQHIYNYGAMDAVMSTNGFYNSTRAYYNASNTINSADHAITIVGWDDNYSASNFSPSKPSINGAWIVKNSWGTNTGESGYFYMSYADKSLYQVNAGILNASNTRNFDKMYSLNPLGQNSHLSYGRGTVYARNVFSGSKAGEKLTSITVGFVNASSYEIYVDKTGTETRVTNMEKVATGSYGYEGYKTIDLANPVTLTGEKFAVVVKYTSSGQASLPMEARDSNFYRNASANSGESYVSSSGVSWTEISTSKYNYANCSIKAYTKTGNSATFTGITAPAAVSLGQSFNVKANMSGTTTGVQYKFVYYYPSQNKWGLIKDLSTTDNTSCTLTMPGNFVVYVDVLYPNGQKETKTVNVNVVAPTVSSMTMPSSIKVGTSFNVKASVSGATSGLQYKFVYYNRTQNLWGLIRDFSSSDNITFSLAIPATYDIYVDVKTQGGYVFSRNQSIVVTNSAVFNGITVPSSVNMGNNFNITANMSGSTSGVQYKFVYYYPSQDKWGLIKDTSTASMAYCNLQSPGNYVIYVDVFYPNGQKETKTTNINVIGPTLNSITMPSSVVIGKGFNIIPNVSNASSGLRYKFVYYYPSQDKWGLIKDTSTANTAYCSLQSPGNYVIYVDMFYPNGQKETKTKNINVVGPVVSNINMPSSTIVDNSIDITANVSNATSGLQYKFVYYYKNQNTWVLMRDFGSNNKISYLMPKAGNYIIYVDVKTPSGYMTTGTKEISVTNAPNPATFVGINAPTSVFPNNVFRAEANMSGNTAGVQYKFVYYYPAQNSWGLIRDFTTSNYTNLSFAKTGEYDLYIDVKYPNGQMETRIAKINVIK